MQVNGGRRVGRIYPKRALIFFIHLKYTFVNVLTATGEAMAEIILDGAAKTTDVSQLDPARFVGRRGKLWV